MVKIRGAKKRKFVKSILAGKTQRQAALDAGYSPGCADSAASKAIRDPEVKKDIAAWAEKHDLGMDRVAKEYDRGLRQSRADGKHIEYTRDIARINGIIGREEEIRPQSQILIIQAIQQAEAEGL